MLGDLAKGNNEKLQGVALAYGQMSAAGRANMQDLNQLINAGVPILAPSQSMGKPIPEIRKMVGESKIGFSEVDKALKGLVGEGGLFYDMMKRWPKRRRQALHRSRFPQERRRGGDGKPHPSR